VLAYTVRKLSEWTRRKITNNILLTTLPTKQQHSVFLRNNTGVRKKEKEVQYFL
jgi:hypothetical protein